MSDELIFLVVVGLWCHLRGRGSSCRGWLVILTGQSREDDEEKV